MGGGTVTEIDVFGIPIPDAGALFLVTLTVHVGAGLTCVVAGALAALSLKGGVRHVRSGRVFVGGLALVFATMAVMVVIRWPENAHLLVIGCVAFAVGLVGFLDRRRSHRDVVHIAAMGVSYVALLTGFYVDNGPHLPLWDRLPQWSYWLLPGLVGLPVIGRAIHRRRRVTEVTS
jgi:UDP-N-acetylmuramyl pentapeptide phosphotransferase/UDP-N-acetylglucosamine-1-phosphate transferase